MNYWKHWKREHLLLGGRDGCFYILEICTDGELLLNAIASENRISANILPREIELFSA